MRLDAGDVVLFGDGIDHRAEERADDRLRVLAALLQRVKELRQIVQQRVLKLGQEREAVRAGGHDRHKNVLDAAGQRREIQSGLRDHFFRHIKADDRYLVPALFKLLAQQHIGAHVARRSDSHHRYPHSISP